MKTPAFFDLSHAVNRQTTGKALLLAASVWAVVVIVGWTPQWRELELFAFDFLVVADAPLQTDAPIAIVGIDEPSFIEIGAQWPWPRRVHARLVEALERAGARVIAFDILFAEASDADEDRIFAEAIRSAGRVVLAADVAFQETRLFKQVMPIEPLERFVEAGATTGLSGLIVDPDLVVRQVPPPPAFWYAVVGAYRGEKQTLGPPGSVAAPEARIRYIGPDHSFAYVSYYQALEPEKFLPADTFRDRIVLVGFDVQTSPDPKATQTDLFASPFMAFTGRLTPGVEIHANLVANALSGRTIGEAPTGVVLGLSALMVLICLWGMRNFRPLVSGLFGLGLVLVMGIVTWWLFTQRDSWLPVLAPTFAVALMYLGQGSLAFLEERRRKQEIKKAFGHYVSPYVVEELAAHPEKLVLGGVRKELTLMFSDLEGFTRWSEGVSPEQVAHYLNRYLTAMTCVILEHGGTIPKFIGDGIFAFWGAPLEDPRHAERACRAALDMQSANRRLREDFVEEGLPAIRMRIGIHTGPAVVGNMGSSDRFDYTAVGDSVNLASRLEGANKLYGSEILISHTTAQWVGDDVTLRRVDKVRVQGKTQPIEVYTPCDSEVLLPMNNKAIDLYRQRRWSDSDRLWQEISVRFPEDAIAAVYRDRIAVFRREPPVAGWDGSTALEKM